MRLHLRPGSTAPFLAARGFVFVALGVAWPWTPGRAVDAAELPAAVLTPADATAKKDKKDQPPPKPVFAPEVEKKLTDLLAKVADAHRKAALKKMGQIIDKLVKVTGLGEQGRPALEATAREVVERSLPDWKNEYERIIRSEIGQFPEDILAAIDAALGAGEETLPVMNGYETGVLPQDDIAWTQAVQRALTPEQSALWQKSLADEQQALHAEIDDHLNSWLEPSRQAMQDSLLAKVAGIGRTLNLPKERVEELRTLATKAVDESVGKMRARQEKLFASMEDEQRREVLKGGGIYLTPAPAERPENLPAWKTELTRFLSADEQKRLEADTGEHQARRVRALARLLLAEFDKKVALTASQREPLEPVFERIAADKAQTFTDQSEPYFQLNVYGILSSGIKSAEAEVQAIVEPLQWKHWLDACDVAAEQDRARIVRPALLPEEKTAAPPEPEDYELAVSDFLDDLTHKMRRRTLSEFLLRAEDVGRAASLPADQLERLKTAGRGAVEESLVRWKSNINQQIRAFVADTSDRMIRFRLKGLQPTNFIHTLDPPPETQALWLNALKTELDATQTAAMEASAKEREAFRDAAVARFVVAMFDEFQPITTEQEDKIEPVVAAMITEYQPDMSRTFGDFSGWFRTGYSLYLPIAAIPEAELKSIIGPERFEGWMHSQQYAASMNYWPMIKQTHEARMRAGKK